ncbi:MAG: transposase [Planctomycetota bacterium]|jgi:transposase InsO family protein
MVGKDSVIRITGVLDALGIAHSSWYRKSIPVSERKRPGPARKPIAEQIVLVVVEYAKLYPWYGYKTIAVICRRAGHKVKNRHAWRVMAEHGLLQKRHSSAVEIYQASKLYELLPKGPNELWQMDITYVHIPGYGWRYAITVIDYYSRYLLACHLTSSYCAVNVTHALDLARADAERLHGPLEKIPFLVTDNGPSFIAKRFHRHIKGLYSHVRIQYRTPTQLGLLERFHRTLKQEEIYWRLYDSPVHAERCLEEFRGRYNTIRPHWSLIPQAGGDPMTPYDVYVEGKTIRIRKWQGWAKAAKAKLDKMMTEEAA